jgi:excisionase family DNA binding protein
MSKLYTIGEVAKELNVALVTIRRWEAKGYVNVIHTPGGHRRIEESEFYRLLGVKGKDKPSSDKRAFIYCRVSTKKQCDSGNLDRQEERLIAYAYRNNYEIVKIYKETASGINENRNELQKMLTAIKNREADYVLIEYKDRLARFGYKYLQKYIEDFNAKIIVIDNKEVDYNKELVDDLIAIVTSFSARIYGTRGGKKLASIVKELEKERGAEVEDYHESTSS